MHSLDLCGLRRPQPILKLRRMLRELEPGAAIRLIGDDPHLVEDIPAYCHQAGLQLLRAEDHGDHYAFELSLAPAVMAVE